MLRAWYVTSATEMTERIELSFTSDTASPAKGGIMRRTDWGNTTRQSAREAAREDGPALPRERPPRRAGRERDRQDQQAEHGGDDRRAHDPFPRRRHAPHAVSCP